MTFDRSPAPRRDSPRLQRVGLTLLTAAVLPWASSCATSRWTADKEAPIDATLVADDPRAELSQPQPARAPGEVRHAVVSDAMPAGSHIQPLNYAQIFDDEEAVASVPRITRISAQQPSADVPDSPPTDAIVRHAAEPRVHLPSDAMLPAAVGWMEGAPYPEEILCDGGDGGYPFHYEGPDRAGLEPEDTVAEFVDHEGVAHVRVSTRTCVYAPRFGSVRLMSQPNLDYSVNKAAGAHEDASLHRFDAGLAAGARQQIDQANALRLRERAGGVNMIDGDTELNLVVKAELESKTLNVYEDLNYVVEGQVRQTDEAMQNYVLQIAGLSIANVQPIIIARDELGQEVISSDFVAEFSGSEDRRPPGDLRVSKHSDRTSVQPGELITFTIRFVNSGGRELTQVRIIDHLSPRLKYIEGSVVSERGGRLSIADDADGSQILTLELQTPLAGGESGEISFRAKAR